MLKKKSTKKNQITNKQQQQLQKQKQGKTTTKKSDTLPIQPIFLKHFSQVVYLLLSEKPCDNLCTCFLNFVVSTFFIIVIQQKPQKDVELIFRLLQLRIYCKVNRTLAFDFGFLEGYVCNKYNVKLIYLHPSVHSITFKL